MNVCHARSILSGRIRSWDLPFDPSAIICDSQVARSSDTLVVLCMPVAPSPSLSRAEAVAEAFLRLYDKGLVYRGSYMVNWSPHLQTAVSDLVSADPVVHHPISVGANQ